MRHDYPLSEQTEFALEGRVTQVAKAMEVHRSYVYAFLSGAQTDPYPKFRHLFRGVCGVSKERAKPYLDELVLIYDSSGMPLVMKTLDAAQATGNIGKEFVEFIEAELANKPVQVQIKEIDDVIAAAKAKRKCLIALFNATRTYDKTTEVINRNRRTAANISETTRKKQTA